MDLKILLCLTELFVYIADNLWVITRASVAGEDPHGSVAQMSLDVERRVWRSPTLFWGTDQTPVQPQQHLLLGKYKSIFSKVLHELKFSITWTLDVNYRSSTWSISSSNFCITADDHNAFHQACCRVDVSQVYQCSEVRSGEIEYKRRLHFNPCNTTSCAAGLLSNMLQHKTLDLSNSNSNKDTDQLLSEVSVGQAPRLKKAGRRQVRSPEGAIPA